MLNVAQSLTSTRQYTDINRQKVQTPWLLRKKNEKLSNLKPPLIQMWFCLNKNEPESVISLRSPPRAEHNVECRLLLFSPATYDNKSIANRFSLPFVSRG